MSSLVEWIGAEADNVERPANAGRPKGAEENENQPAKTNKCFPSTNSVQKSAAHDCLAHVEDERALRQEDPLDCNPDLWLYRERTVGLLRRYMRFSLETGRLPSLVGREFFRAKITFYRAVTFEDRIIFVRDVEACLDRLAYLDQQLVARVILQEHSQDDTARILHCSRRTIQRRVPEVIDLVSEEFLRVGLLTELPPRRRETQ